MFVSGCTRTFSAGYSLVVQSTVDSSWKCRAATRPFVLAFFLLVKSLEKSYQPLLLVNWIGGQNKNRTQNPAVMESKAVLFTTQQPSKWGDELRHRAATLLRKSQQMRQGMWPESQECLADLDFRILFILKARGVWLLVVNFLLWDSFVLAAAHVGQVTMFL